MVYDVAFALVWADDGDTVDTTNEAYAFASCADCAAVAVGFQVVLIVGQTDVIVPENLSASANYNCVRCLTYALASQLVLTLDGPLSSDGTARLNALWQEIAAYGKDLRNQPLSEIQGRLSAYKEQIMAVIKADPSATPAGSSGTAATPGATPRRHIGAHCRHRPRAFRNCGPPTGATSTPVSTPAGTTADTGTSPDARQPASSGPAPGSGATVPAEQQPTPALPRRARSHQRPHPPRRRHPKAGTRTAPDLTQMAGMRTSFRPSASDRRSIRSATSRRLQPPDTRYRAFHSSAMMVYTISVARSSL